MKPVNRNLADEFHEESKEGVDAVFERMWQVGGKRGSYADTFDVSQNTIKTWIRRGAVSTKFLQGYAEKHGTTLDYLMHGDAPGEGDRLILDDVERMLVRSFRAAPENLRDAAMRVLLGGDHGGPVQNIKTNKGALTQTGSLVTVKGNTKK